MQAITLITISLATVGILAVVATIIARRNALWDRAAFISKYTFPERLERRVRELHPHLDRAQAALVIEGLRQYFLACLTARRSRIARHVGMPSRAVDDAWHEFLLLKREYAEFCQGAFGRYLTHIPEEEMTEPMNDALANTLHQLRRPSPSGAGWAALGAMPLLFAIDRELGVSQGFLHDPATLADLEARRAKAGANANGGGGCGAGSTGGAHCGPSGGSACDAGGGACGGGSCGGGGCGS